MSKAKICDNCNKIIDEVDITIKGFNVEFHKTGLGFEIEKIEDFCSFNCLSEWAKDEQKVIDEAKINVEKYKGIPEEK